MTPLACRRFSRLCGEAADRALDSREEGFLSVHRARCASCRREEETARAALGVLRGAALDPAPDRRFDDRVVRLALVQRGRATARYWAPALAGAAAAALAIFAALDLVVRAEAPRSADAPFGTARRDGRARMLELPTVPPFGR